MSTVDCIRNHGILTSGVKDNIPSKALKKKGRGPFFRKPKDAEPIDEKVESLYKTHICKTNISEGFCNASTVADVRLPVVVSPAANFLGVGSVVMGLKQIHSLSKAIQMEVEDEKRPAVIAEYFIRIVSMLSWVVNGISGIAGATLEVLQLIRKAATPALHMLSTVLSTIASFAPISAIVASAIGAGVDIKNLTSAIHNYCTSTNPEEKKKFISEIKNAVVSLAANLVMLAGGIFALLVFIGVASTPHGMVAIVATFAIVATICHIYNNREWFLSKIQKIAAHFLPTKKEIDPVLVEGSTTAIHV